MTDILNNYEKEQIAKLTKKKSIPNFRSGDTLRVNIKVIEGDRSRIQSFEGICIAKKSAGLNSSFTVRKISHGEGVERVFPMFSPTVDSIKVFRKGDVNRAKLYYLRKRSGKSARISDKDRGDEANIYDASDDTSNSESVSENREETFIDETKQEKLETISKDQDLENENKQDEKQENTEVEKNSLDKEKQQSLENNESNK